MSKPFHARKKPILIEAIKWTGNNYDEVLKFAGDIIHVNERRELTIPTLEGNMLASIDDYIIKGVQSELYPCKPDIFLETYEVIPEN